MLWKTPAFRLYFALRRGLTNYENVTDDHTLFLMAISCEYYWWFLVYFFTVTGLHFFQSFTDYFTWWAPFQSFCHSKQFFIFPLILSLSLARATGQLFFFYVPCQFYPVLWIVYSFCSNACQCFIHFIFFFLSFSSLPYCSSIFLCLLFPALPIKCPFILLSTFAS